MVMSCFKNMKMVMSKHYLTLGLLVFVSTILSSSVVPTDPTNVDLEAGLTLVRPPFFGRLGFLPRWFGIPQSPEAPAQLELTSALRSPPSTSSSTPASSSPPPASSPTSAPPSPPPALSPALAPSPPLVSSSAPAPSPAPASSPASTPSLPPASSPAPAPSPDPAPSPFTCHRLGDCFRLTFVTYGTILGVSSTIAMLVIALYFVQPLHAAQRGRVGGVFAVCVVLLFLLAQVVPK